VSDEKKVDESKKNKFIEFVEKFKEVSKNLITHPYIEKNINYISFSIILLILIIVRIQNPEFVKSISSISFDSYQKIFKSRNIRD